ncbi:hypothetical protein Y032_0098g3107 [Ancylostoma ceylanicum]|uniref:Uncharacterized protein n=1 Tax=Ancylostoma ceylanicum TaxID=53326 RepID=A0A016TJ77_9BILA|nr:hypothetical protein Y032_0098g3107 [Ancylostoma ceylanicum]
MPLKCFDGWMKKEPKQASPSTRERPRCTFEDVSEYILVACLTWWTTTSPRLRKEEEHARWAAYNSIKSVLEDTEDQKLRRSLNSTVLPTLSYARETWALTKITETQLRSTQISLERRMFGLSLGQQRERHLHNSDVRAMSKVRDAVLHADESKHRPTGQLRLKTEQCGKEVRTRARPTVAEERVV